MAYHDGHAPSNRAKTTLLLLTLTGVIFSTTILLENKQISVFRMGLLQTCALIFFVRLFVCLFVFVKRKVSWFEGITVGVLYGILVIMFSVWGTRKNFAVGSWEIIGVALFSIGSFINSYSDYQRYIWKKKTENKGHIYTQGLFRYAIHINFFGDSIMFVGYAAITHNIMSFIPVMFIVLNFLFLQIPRLDDYLKNKYRDDFTEYAGRTKKYIPGIY